MNIINYSNPVQWQKTVKPNYVKTQENSLDKLLTKLFHCTYKKRMLKIKTLMALNQFSDYKTCFSC